MRRVSSSKTCRRRHLKCDEDFTPDCGRCRRSGRDCVLDDLLTFRDSQSIAARGQRNECSPTKKLCVHRDPHDIFDDKQKWLITPRTISFLDETAYVDAQYRQQRLRDNDTVDESPTIGDPKVLPQDDGIDKPSSMTAAGEANNLVEKHQPQPDLNDSSTCLREPSFLAPNRLPTPTSQDLHQHLMDTDNSDADEITRVVSLPSFPVFISPVASQSSHVARSVPNLNLSSEATHLQLYGPRMPLPFQDAQEAMLFQYYMESLAGQLDITDIQRHFAIDVPERALFSPVLLEALLAFSARHRSRTSDFEPAIGDRHHQACVRLMIPMLNEKELVADETLFAATVILRAFEETSGSKMGSEPERHLTGTSVFANAQLEFQTWGGLGHNAFWCYVRQCIYMSLLTQTQLKVNLKGWEEQLSFDLGFDDTSDCTWAQRMIWIVAEVVSCSFGNGDADWDHLDAKVDLWETRRPKSFDPILYRPRDVEAKRWFPEIRLGHPWHVTGMQYYYIARLFLAIYKPNGPKAGLGYQRLRRTMDEKVLTNAEAICGISLATPLAAARITACTALVACGPWFHDRPPEQQELILQLLRRAEVENALPTADLVLGLKAEWNRI